MKKGFTLVELIAVLAILAILSTLVLVNIIQKANKMKVISEAQVEEAVISAAKTYVSKNSYLKTRAKSGENISIEYTKLKSEGYLPDNMLDVTTYRKINISEWTVCFSYDRETNLKYEYLVTLKTSCK